MQFPKTGLYAITQTEHKSPQHIINEVNLALQAGVKVVQYRDKQPLDAVYLASELVKVCHTYHCPLLINDDVGLALRVHADGVHLGKDDGSIRHARQLLGEEAIIGVSCYNDVQRALAAEQQGANYTAFGRFFPSSSKPLAAPAEIETLIKAKQCLSNPIVAIGGILPSNGAELLEAGADVLAVIGGVFAQDVEQSTRAYQSLFL